MENKKMRIDLEEWEYEMLQELIKEANERKSNIYKNLIEKIEKPKIIRSSENKRSAAEKATETRSKIAKEKIKKAVEELELELKRGFIKKISYFAIAKKSGVHINTVKKYHFID